MSELARLIKADVGLSVGTIDLDGWDTHFVQSQLIPGLMETLAAGLAAFVDDLGEYRDRVDVVTMTEFGRRVYENTSFGTDHGSGSVMMVIGDGAGRGGPIQAGWRDLTKDSLTGPGDVPVSINYRDVLAPILMRHSPEVSMGEVFHGHSFLNLA